MPEIKNTFLQSKMNKDLDARILPNGQYRDAQNISVSRSEGADVGALENVLGNTLLTDLKTSLGYLEESKVTGAIPGAIVLSALEVIGYFMDVSGDRIFLFLTDYRDSSNDQLSNFAPADIYNGVNFVAKGAACYIVQYNISSKISRVLVGGNFLNFSKTHPILNVNLLENLLFWTDNRNQPRKINVEYAFNKSYELNSDPYYNNEDHVSVAKYAPFSCMEFIDSSNNSTLISKSEEFLPAHVIDYISAIPTATPPRSIITLGTGVNYTFGTTTSDLYGDVTNGDKLIVISQPDIEYTVTNATATSVTIDPPLDTAVNVNDRIKIFRRNPDYDDEFIGDPNLLKDEFAKFSYRFKYDDDEYSLMAPFTQAAYVPNQFGYFINDDEEVTAEAGDVQFMRNRVDNVKLQITLPELASQLERKLKVKEIQILIKNSDEQAIRVIEDVPIERIVDQSGASTSYVYDYLSTKAIKVLPEAELIRVHDKVPVKAMTQEVIANRVVYGNFVDKHSSPDYLDYELAYQTKGNDNFTTEFPMHTVKQNRSYQVGIVLVDRYGRASNVILNDETKVTSTGKNSTIYADYENFGGNSIEFWGNNLALGLLQEIPATLSKPGYPGLYSETNPLGYYTYRIVIKQQEQDYYNVYVPGALSGDLLWDGAPQWSSTSPPGFAGNPEDVVENIEKYLPRFITTNRISMINLFGDNINKVPRELKTAANANDDTFGSDTLLFNRVNPIYDTTEGSYNKQSAVSKTGEKVISIEPFKNLGYWTTTKGNGFPFNSPDTSVPPQPYYPYFGSQIGTDPYVLNFHDIFFNASANPFIATIETDFKIGATPEYTDSLVNGSSTSDMKDAKDKIERAWQDLGVFETKPTKSVLDIYWETSSSDLISVLNNEPTSDLPAGFLDTVGNNTAEGDNLDYNHFEDNAIGTDITAQFQLVNNLGNPLSTFPTLTLQSVVDGSLNNRTSEFSLFSPSAGNFRLRTAAEFVYNSNANVLENYTFNFLATDSASTPTYTNVPLQLTNCSLQNVAPNWITQPNPSYTITLPSYPSYPLFIFSIQLGNVENGSANSNRDTEEIVYTVVDAGTNPGNGADDFEILSNTPNFALYAKESVFFGSGYSLKIRATDANGNGLFTDSDTFTVVLST